MGGAHNKSDHPPYQPIDPMGGAHNKSDYPPYQPINPPGHFTHGVPNTPPSPGNPMNMSAGSHPPAPPTHTIAAWNDPPTLRHTKKTTNYVAPPPMRMPLASTQETQLNQAPPIAPPPDNKPGTPTKPTPVVATPSEPQSLPQEHAIIHTVLNGLLIQCKARANNIVMKRKVDDIQRKLEVLYDLIRQGRLSHDILQGLHAIIYDVQGMNYAGGLVRLNHMVAASNLSEITSFMPAVKTLLQLGIQLKV
jgi:protein transport protein SEC31